MHAAARIRTASANKTKFCVADLIIVLSPLSVMILLSRFDLKLIMNEIHRLRINKS